MISGIHVMTWHVDLRRGYYRDYSPRSTIRRCLYYCIISVGDPLVYNHAQFTYSKIQDALGGQGQKLSAHQ